MLLAAPTEFSALADEALLARQDSLVAERRRIDAELVAIAGEIARRSPRDAGFSGLAQRSGLRTPEQLLQRAAGFSAREASDLVRVGSLPADDPVALAVAAGEVSVAAGAAIAGGLGEATAGIEAARLEAAAAELLGRSRDLTAEQLVRAARDLRAELDADSIVERERRLRDRRSLRMIRLEDGTTRLVALLDPESAAIVRDAYDVITSPRRGGPRFVAGDAVERARRLERDPRTTEQLALDAFVELLRLGARVAPGELLGGREPAVRVVVTDADLARRGGSARIEGESAVISIASAERRICEAGTVPIRFDGDGQVVNVGREHRLFTARQRIGLAVRDGGCRWPGCDRPPSWCEAHHIDEWKAHGGRTDIADGVLLCRFHHLYVHDRQWRIRRQGRAEYFAVKAGHGGGPRDGERLRLPAKTRMPELAAAGAAR
ncbi:MAG: hypothetical protein BGO95_04430 [Micrococcales bacterium 73-13]|nr:MAG: hypothetical protein BGO95_04430 [Micrococcales bacterium 73-13]